MIKLKIHNFVERSYLRMLFRLRNRSHSPLELRGEISAFLWGLCIFITFVLAVQRSLTASKLETASNNKNEFSKYEQWELPGNDRLPSTGQGLDSIPNNPARAKGVALDRIEGNLLLYTVTLNQGPVMGIKDREVMSNQNSYLL